MNELDIQQCNNGISEDRKRGNGCGTTKGAKESTGLRELALFAGAGGGILGGQLLGWKTVCAVERDAYASAVLAQRQNDGLLDLFPIWSDVCTFDGKPWRGIVDVISGGFPCQDISAAGKGAGIDGERSGLWSEFARIIREVRPRFVFVENSPVLTSRGLGRVLGDLAAIGYHAEWGVLGASDVGAPHKRERIWIVAYSDLCGSGKDWQSSELRSNRTKQPSENPQRCIQSENAEKWWEQDPAEVADSSLPNDKNNKRGQKQIESGGESRSNEGGAIKPSLGRVAHGVAFRVDRLKAIGNGQVPQCAAEAFRQLVNRAIKL